MTPKNLQHMSIAEQDELLYQFIFSALLSTPENLLKMNTKARQLQELLHVSDDHFHRLQTNAKMRLAIVQRLCQ